jgi:hypothetical protein
MLAESDAISEEGVKRKSGPGGYVPRDRLDCGAYEVELEGARVCGDAVRECAEPTRDLGAEEQPCRSTTRPMVATSRPHSTTS